MKRLIPIIFVLVAACAAAQDPGAQIDAEIVVLQARADALEAQAHDLPQAALDTLQSQITALQAQAHDLPQTELDALQAQVDAIFARLATLETDRDDHEARITALEGAPPPPGPVCGNDIIETGEVCDGTALAGQTCTSQGFDSGTLACSADCLSFDTSACVTNPPPPPVGVYDLLATHLPPPGEFALVPNTDANSVFFTTAVPPSRNVWNAWNGMSFDLAGGHWWAHGGGHTDYGGNEVYEFTFENLTWARLNDPAPLTGPGLNPDGTCPRPASGPAVGHTYDAALYVPTRDEFLSLGLTLYCASGTPSGTDGIWIWSNDSQSFAPHTQTTRETGEFYFSGSVKMAYDPIRDRVYVIGKVGSAYGFYELDPTNNYAITLIAVLPTVNQGHLVLDQARRELFYTSRNWGTYRMPIALDGTPTLPPILITSGIGSSSSFLPIALHAPSGDLISWDGGNSVKRLDPDTGTVTDVGHSSGPSSGSTSTVTRKWVYIPALDVFAGIVDSRSGIWLYKLPAPPSAGNFQQRCNANGVVFCDPLDTEGPWGVDITGMRRLMLNPDGTQGLPTSTWWRKWRGVTGTSVAPALDTSVKASGTGSLKFVYPSNSGSGGAGDFTTNFSDDLSQTFGEGDTFYIQYRWRASCDFVYQDCTPESPTYKTTRRFYATRSSGPAAAKLSIVNDSDPAIGESSDSCTSLHIVLNHGPDHYLGGYHNCGWYEGFDRSTGENFFGSNQFDYQPTGMLGVGDVTFPTCWRIPDPTVNQKLSWGNTGPGCFYLEADEWMTVQMGISVGTWQPNRVGAPDSHIDIWLAREGGPQIRVVDHNFYNYGPSASFPAARYGKIWLLPYMTDKDSAEAHPVAYVWYDEMIVSTQFIGGPA